MSFSVFSPIPPFQKADFVGNQPTSACDCFFLEPTAKHSFPAVAQLCSREAKKHVRGIVEYWIWGKKPALARNPHAVLLISAIHSLYSWKGSHSVLVSPWLAQLKAPSASSCPAGSASILTRAAAPLSPLLLLQREQTGEAVVPVPLATVLPIAHTAQPLSAIAPSPGSCTCPRNTV